MTSIDFFKVAKLTPQALAFGFVSHHSVNGIVQFSSGFGDGKLLGGDLK